MKKEGRKQKKKQVLVKIPSLKLELGPRDMAHGVEAISVKPKYLSLIARTHGVEGENGLV